LVDGGTYYLQDRLYLIRLFVYAGTWEKGKASAAPESGADLLYPGARRSSRQVTCRLTCLRYHGCEQRAARPAVAARPAGPLVYEASVCDRQSPAVPLSFV